jgi:hypothetical protein
MAAILVKLCVCEVFASSKKVIDSKGCFLELVLKFNRCHEAFCDKKKCAGKAGCGSAAQSTVQLFFADVV